jgi:membrane-bound metal-dependent hydrolase YbcI (DUF457 family)
MPSPVGHALGGLIVGLATDRAGTPHRARGSSWTAALGTRHVAWCTIVACLPDLDFLWGRHNLETHSLGFALIVGAAVFAWRRSARLAVACALAVGTHVLFDWLGSDTTPPLGVTALWPFSREFYFADAFIFEAISRRYWLPGFVQHNLMAVAREVAMLAPIAAVIWWRRRTERRTINATPA